MQDADTVPTTETETVTPAETEVETETETKDVPAQNADTGFEDKPACHPEQIAE